MSLKQKLKQYVEVIKSINNGDIELSNEQFEFLKELYKKEGYVVGLHNTKINNSNSFFQNGLYNNKDYHYNRTCDITNTVYYTPSFYGLMLYHHPQYTTIILAIPEDVITGKKGIFEELQNDNWGIPPQYIIGAFQDGKVIKNENYDPNYENKNAALLEEPEKIYKTQAQKIEESNICGKAFYDIQEGMLHKFTNKENHRR